MLYRFFKRYLSAIFLFGVLLGSMHHHEDLKLHSDCKICIVHSHITNADTPEEPVYITQLNIYTEIIPDQLFSLQQNSISSTLQARAPPSFS